MDTFEPQLAGQHGDITTAVARPDRYAVELKLDGIRALVTIKGNEVSAVSRNGLPRSLGLLRAKFQRLAEAVPMLKAGTVFDGELVAASWGETMHLLGKAGQREEGLTFVAFDLPVLAGASLRGETWEKRRAALELVMQAAEAPLTISALLTPAMTLPEEVWARGAEGLIIKDRTATYQPGNRTAWTKVKNTETTEAIVMGFEPGTLHGKVLLGQYKGGTLVQVAKCKRQRANDGKVGDVVEFSFIGRMPGTDAYRHPQWVRVRTDVDPASVTC
jgi:ATP-dependent DNA ligase